MKLIEPGPRWPLMDACGTRAIETFWQRRLPAGTLMGRAGLACARLALAVAPHARRVWVACGPGNNGGDGLQAAIHLAGWGKSVWVTWLGEPSRAPADTQAAWHAFEQAGLRVQPGPPEDFDLCIDALLGIGAQRPPQDSMAGWIARINFGRARGALVLSVDLPSGLLASSGQAHDPHVQATHTLSLLTLKTGLFTHQGRDACGDIWFDDLGVDLGMDMNAEMSADTNPDAPPRAPTAWLNPLPRQATRAHASHKGSYGEVAVIGGAPGMAGALWLAASAALHHGAGRVYAAALDGQDSADGAGGGLLPGLPEVMCRRPDELPLDAPGMATVCGCGGGMAVERWLPRVLEQAQRLVLDADALNAIARDSHGIGTGANTATQQDWAGQLRARHARRQETILTPHPLEAARLLGSDTARVQARRLEAARELAQQLQCTVVLKGSGTLIAAPGEVPRINPTGNARLSTAGTGDVLAGMAGAELAAGHPAFEAACRAAYTHGLRAQTLHLPQAAQGVSLTASQIAAG